MSCDHRDMAVAFLSLAVMFTGLNRAAFIVNHNDFAPKYAGVLFGITNTFATVPGMIAPIVAGALTPNILDSNTDLMCLFRRIPQKNGEMYFTYVQLSVYLGRWCLEV
ncbi:Hypothetical predicted protein [Mytilus galloprovincialis]|uniref:Uncharacterized protein n=1 Tax=Mytilus galloprovincialis TaxID=29158 RepID=A0A8B6HQP4_MYTGA|nr:Hypothetical predicted protein [Mytilus galloprovincialis]